MPAPPLSILILAAGAARRMRGQDKLLEPVAGQPMLRHIAGIAGATGCPVLVTLPPDRPARLAALSGLGLQTLIVPDAATGMAASLRAGLNALPPDHAVLMLLADLPEITPEDLARMIQTQARHPDAILRATASDGTPGHPVLFPPWARADLATLDGDTGARAVLLRHKDHVRPVPLPDQHATTDLDTPEDWATWRAGQTGTASP
jgi:molybdenum cofactor cytidylyltransferase